MGDGRRRLPALLFLHFTSYVCVIEFVFLAFFVYPFPVPLSRTLFTILLILSYESSDITFSYDGGPARPRGRANAISSSNADSYFCTKRKRQKKRESKNACTTLGL